MGYPAHRIEPRPRMSDEDRRMFQLLQDDELAIRDFINQLRRQQGLEPLKDDQAITVVICKRKK